MKIETFETTKDAYDATQCCDIPRGTVLHIPSEGVVGVADTWPFAVTADYGSLHGSECHPQLWVDADPALVCGVDAAISFAGSEGYKLDNWASPTNPPK
jgi:hypothetical protein